MKQAAHCRDELKVAKEQISELQVCSICWVEKPSFAALKRLTLERWYAGHVCAYCYCTDAVAVATDTDEKFVTRAEASLKYRAWSELRLLIRHLHEKKKKGRSDTSREKKVKTKNKNSCSTKLKKQLRELEAGLRVHRSQGRGVRLEGKSLKTELAALLSHVHRTRERLALEPRTHREFSALTFVLKCLGMQ